MQKLKSLNSLKSNLLINIVHRNISNKMRLKRYLSGIDLKPDQFISIGKDFKAEMKNNNIKRAVEILGKYNDKTLARVLDYNNPLMNINLNLNDNPFVNAMMSQSNTKDKNTNKENINNTSDGKTENSGNTKEDTKKKNNKFELFNYMKSYEKIFTPEEIAMIKEISADKEKLVEYLKENSLSFESLILKSNFSTDVNVTGIKKENKLFYFIVAMIFFWMFFDYKGTLKYFYENLKSSLPDNLNFIFGRYTDQNGKLKLLLGDSEKESADKQNQLPKAIYKFKLATNLSERLGDVKGIDEVRTEIEEIVLMLKNPKDYEEVGAKLIRGILLIGKPGTGKTLLARALAGESGVNFIYLNASEFDKSLVGAGSKMLKELFGFARANQPCIVFIDEIDTLLHKGRRSGKYSSTYERGLINTFLSEMDGFNKREHIFVLGATNSEKDLDPAALRPGRFDKIVHVPLPDSNGRKEIIDYYLAKIKMPLAADVIPNKLASITPGFSGAEIENMVNLAIIEAVDTGKNEISKEEFENSRDRVVLGIKRRPKNISNRVLLQTAIHEAGHTLVCFKDKICNKSIHKVTILPRGETKGATSTFQDDDFQGAKEDFISLIDMSLAGIMAEEIYFGDQKMGTGCGRDLERANRIAKQMVQKFAMNKFGYMVIDEGNYMYHRISEVTRNEMDQSVGDILNKRSDLVKEILNTNISELKVLAQNLVEYGELDRTDIDNIFQGKKVEKAEDKKLRNVIIDNIPI